MHKILWAFGMQMDHLILFGRPNLVLINKKRLGVPVEHRAKMNA